MTDPFQAWSPVDIENRLHQCITDLTIAEKKLREARDEETTAEIAYRSAHRKAMIRAPKVTRGGLTTAERDAHVDEECGEEWAAYRLAQTKREAAQDHVRTQRDVCSAVQSIGTLVRQAYQLAGRS